MILGAHLFAAHELHEQQPGEPAGLAAPRHPKQQHGQAGMDAAGIRTTSSSPQPRQAKGNSEGLALQQRKIRLGIRKEGSRESSLSAWGGGGGCSPCALPTSTSVAQGLSLCYLRQIGTGGRERAGK